MWGQQRTDKVLGPLLALFMSWVCLTPDGWAQQHSQNPPTGGETATGVVLSLKEKKPLHAPSSRMPVDLGERVQEAQVQVISGTRTGQVYTVENIQGENPVFNIPLQPGARVLLNVEEHPEAPQKPPNVYITNRDRLPVLMLLTGLLLLAGLLLCTATQLRALFVGLIALVMIRQSMLPSILNGVPGTLVLFALALVYAFVGAMLLLPERLQTTRMMLLTVLATLLNLAVMLLLVAGSAHWAPLQGFVSENMADLWFTYKRLDFPHMLFAMMLLSHLGIMFHLVLQIAQAMAEGPAETVKNRFQQGFEAGRKLLTPFLLGLPLLYSGLFLPQLLQIQGGDPLTLINLEGNATLLTLMLSGGIAIFTAVPLTAWLFAWLMPSHTLAPVACLGEDKLW